MTVMLLIDVSGSKNFGAVGTFKKDIITEIAATLAFSAIHNNDKVGVIFFTDKIEKFIPPKKGKKHILLVIRELLQFKPENSGTNINTALEYLTSVIKRKCTAFIISDFIDDNDYYKVMSIANKKHDITAIQVYDKRDAQLPDVGLIRVFDAERKTEKWVNTSSSNVRKIYNKWWYERQLKMTDILHRSNVDIATITTDENYVKALMALFKKRGVR